MAVPPVLRIRRATVAVLLSVLLVIAGLIEGFVSASTQSLAYRLSVSSASLVFLLAYLYNGWTALRRAARNVGAGLVDDLGRGASATEVVRRLRELDAVDPGHAALAEVGLNEKSYSVS